MCRMLSATCRPMGCVFLLPFLAAVRRALVLAADPKRSCPKRRLALNRSHELGQQYCPKQNMANSGLKYKSLYLSRRPERGKHGRKARVSSCRFAADFAIIPRQRVDHGMCASAMGAAILRENLHQFWQRRSRFRTETVHHARVSAADTYLSPGQDIASGSG